MRKSTVMAMLLLSVSLIACDNQEVVEVAENTEITENIDTNENEVDPVFETEETVTEEVVAEETVEKNTTAEEPEESATEAVEEIQEVPAEETTTQKVEEKVEAPVEETKEQKVETPVEETKEQKAETPVETPTETKSNQGTTASNVSDLENHPEWTKKRTWTASNGVILKIKDEYAHLDFENNNLNRAAFGKDAIICDGQDLSPNSDFMRAFNEFYYGTPDKFVTDMSSLPLVATPATKQTSAPETDSWKAYKAAFDPLWCMQVEGSTYGVAKIQNYGTGIGLFGGVIGGYVWNLDWIGDCWKLKIMVNPHDLSWNAIRNSLRLVSPDGEQLYEEIYSSAYGSVYGSAEGVLTEYDKWFNVGGSQLMTQNSDYVYYYFK